MPIQKIVLPADSQTGKRRQRLSHNIRPHDLRMPDPKFVGVGVIFRNQMPATFREMIERHSWSRSEKFRVKIFPHNLGILLQMADVEERLVNIEDDRLECVHFPLKRIGYKCSVPSLSLMNFR